MEFHSAEKYISDLLQSGLPDTLFYHDRDHTFEVMEAAMEIAVEEHVNGEELALLKTAALFHDSGFINVYYGHEEEGCRIAREKLPEFGYTAGQIEIICALIMATKTPQQPLTHLEKILCDADLYYLGSDKFIANGIKLFNEWKERGKINSETEWNDVQIKFLESHRYWTASANEKRGKKKAEHLMKLKKGIESFGH